MSIAERYELEDKFSGPAAAIEKHLVELETLSEKLEKAWGKVEQQGSGASKGMAGLVSELGPAALAMGAVVEAAELGISAFEKLGEVVYEAGHWFAESAIHAASFKEATEVSLSTILGSGEAAKRVLEHVVDMAAHLPIETGRAMQASTSLLLGGFNEKQLDPLLLAMSDVGAFNPNDKDRAMDSFVRQIKDIQSVGLSERHLQYLAQEANIPKDQILDRIARIYGTQVEVIEKSLKSVSKDAAIEAILETVASKEGGELGNISNRLSTTVEGLFSTLKSRKLEMFMDLDESPAYSSFRGFLSNLVKLTDSKSEFGRKLKDEIASTFQATFGFVFDGLSGSDGLAKMEAFGEAILHGFHNVVGVTRAAEAGLEGFISALAHGLNLGSEFGDFFSKDLSEDQIRKMALVFEDAGVRIGSAISRIANAMERIGDAQDRFSNSIIGKMLVSLTTQGSFLNDLGGSAADIFGMRGIWEAFSQAGDDAKQGFAAGVGGDDSAPREAGQSLGEITEGALRGQIRSHSPSRLFQEIGEDVSEGFALGIQGGAADAVAATHALVGAPNATRGTASAGITVNLTLNLTGGTELADEIRDAAIEGLENAFEQLGLEVGAAEVH